MSTRSPLKLSKVERAELEHVARWPSTPQGLAKRCRAVLLDDEGLCESVNSAIKRTCGSTLRSRKPTTLFAEAALKVAAYALKV
ncbi:MAG: hypothetical protein ACK4WH_05815 [Phycisphaerales bacterium]